MHVFIQPAIQSYLKVWKQWQRNCKFIYLCWRWLNWWKHRETCRQSVASQTHLAACLNDIFLFFFSWRGLLSDSVLWCVENVHCFLFFGYTVLAWKKNLIMPHCSKLQNLQRIIVFTFYTGCSKLAQAQIFSKRCVTNLRHSVVTFWSVW